MKVDPARDSRLEHLARNRVIGIIRGYAMDSARHAADIAHSEGLDVIEVTLDSPGALGVVGHISDDLPEATVGIGSVTNPAQVDQVADAGASFIVTPIHSETVIAKAAERDIPVVSGAATPTEILNALESGAVAVKVFPAAQLGGPNYLRAVLTPLGHPPLIPTGGVTPENGGEYLASGAVALGAGSSLFSPEIGAGQDWGELRRRVVQWLEAVK